MSLFIAKIKSEIKRYHNIVNQRVLLVQQVGKPDARCSFKEFFHNDGLTKKQIEDIRSLMVGDCMHLEVRQGWIKITREK
jgi:hypothetical protein